MIAALAELATIRSRRRPSKAPTTSAASRRVAPLHDPRSSETFGVVTPIDPNWGFERGTPIDRVYVERFVGAHAADIRGRVLEIAAPDYTNTFGRGVEQVDILMATEGNPQATIVGDLTDAPHIPTTRSTARSSRRRSSSSTTSAPRSRRCNESSRPAACCSRPCPDSRRSRRLEDEEFGEWWHYTGRSVRRLAEEAFGAGERRGRDVRERPRGVGFLYGLAASDLESEELDAHDPLYEVVIGLRAVKRR